MYNKEITTLINQNFKLDSAVCVLIKDFNKIGDSKYLDRAEELQAQISRNHRKIDKMRGEN